MNTLFTFRVWYFLLAILLLVIEILIALYIHDQVIRPYLGDLLVVIMIYCFFRAFLVVGKIQLGLAVFLFACLVETLQYFNVVERIGAGDSRLLKIIIGNAFEWMDILMYALGIAVVMILDNTRIASASRP
jgi:hypothetical protein